MHGRSLTYNTHKNRSHYCSLPVQMTLRYKSCSLLSTTNLRSKIQKTL